METNNRQYEFYANSLSPTFAAFINIIPPHIKCLIDRKIYLKARISNLNNENISLHSIIDNSMCNINGMRIYDNFIKGNEVIVNGNEITEQIIIPPFDGDGKFWNISNLDFEFRFKNNPDFTIDILSLMITFSNLNGKTKLPKECKIPYKLNGQDCILRILPGMAINKIK